MARSPRKQSQLSESLLHRLNAYALAASAAGVTLLALAQPAEGKIIYTKAHVKIGHGDLHLYELDMTHDGVVDFVFAYTAFGSSCLQFRRLSASQNNSNMIVGSSRKGRYLLSALKDGVRIGPELPTHRFGDMLYINSYACKERRTYIGQWANDGRGVHGRYLGLRFFINDKVHYGWARFDVTLSIFDVQATLTGYAYETIPNKPIVAGRTTGPDVITVEPGSLGHLAHGASAIPDWRTKQ